MLLWSSLLKLLQRAVWRPVHLLLCLMQLCSDVFDSIIYNNARGVHSITMQEQPVTMHSSFNVCICQELLICITYYHKTQLQYSYILRQWLNSHSGLAIALWLIKNTCCCELVTIATVTISNPTTSAMCQEMFMSPANVNAVELQVFVNACLTSFTSLSGGVSYWFGEMLPVVGLMMEYIFRVPWSWRMLTWVVGMSWHTPPCFYTFSTQNNTKWRGVKILWRRKWKVWTYHTRV